MIRSKGEIREIKTTELNRAVCFHNAYYHDNRTVQDRVWEYEGYCPELSVFTIAEDSECIVATQGMLPIYINVQGKKELSGKSENTLINPKYRGLLFFKLYENIISWAKNNKMKCIWAYTSKNKIFEKAYRFYSGENAMYASNYILNLKYSSQHQCMLRRRTKHSLALH